ncbi:MAG: MarR family transcriptional regulator [Actinomycetes bacterium]
MPKSANAADGRARLLADCHDAAHEVFAALNRSAGPELLALDLTMGQFKAMATLTINGPQPVGELGRRLGISEPAASLLVDKLEELGLAVRARDPQDRRRTLVTATPAAEELAGRLRQGREEHILAWLGALSDEELDGLTRGFRGLMRIAAGHPAPDDPAGAAPVIAAAVPVAAPGAAPVMGVPRG